MDTHTLAVTWRTVSLRPCRNAKVSFIPKGKKTTSQNVETHCKGCLMWSDMFEGHMLDALKLEKKKYFIQ